MFLEKLSDERKYYFLQLCYHAAGINGKIEDEEKETIDEYTRELGIPCINDNSLLECEDVLSKISEGTDEECRIILAEIIALLKVDSEYDKAEQNFAKKVSDSLCFDDNTLSKYESVIDSYLKGLSEFIECVLH